MARLTIRELDIYSGIFNSLDVDGNAWLSREELKLGLNRLGFRLSDQQAEKLFRKMDKNQDGMITFDEFLAVLDHIEATDQSLYRQAQLRRILTEGSQNGKLHEEEIKSRLQMSEVDAQDTLQSLVTSLERDAAGMIAIEELVRKYRN